jgi:coenzyme F420-reducing hydrogenase gamma subunit
MTSGCGAIYPCPPARECIRRVVGLLPEDKGQDTPDIHLTRARMAQDRRKRKGMARGRGRKGEGEGEKEGESQLRYSPLLFW